MIFDKQFIKTKLIIVVLYLSMILMLTCCRLGTSYQRPIIDLPERFRSSQMQLSHDITKTGNYTWEAFYQDPQLQSLIDLVLKKNLDMKMAYQNMLIYQQYLKQARASGLPVVSAGLSASTSNPSGNSLSGLSLENFIGTNHIEDYTLSTGLSWEIDIWGKIKNQKERALTEYLQSEQAIVTLKTGLIAAAANGYYNLILLHRQLAITMQNIQLSDSIVQMTRLQMAAGDVTLLAVEQTEVQKKNIESLVPTLQQELAVQENALSLLSGKDPGEIQVNLDSKDIFSKVSLSNIPALLLANRPDIREKEYALRAAGASVGISQAEMYPSLSISAAGGLNAFKASNWFAMPASLFGNAVGNLLLPVLNKRRLKTQLEVAKISREQAVLAFRSQVLSAVTEVSDAQIKFDKLQEKHRIVMGQHELLNLAIPHARLLFKQGMATYLEVILAHQSLWQNELLLADLKRQIASARSEVFRSLGGGGK